MLEQYPEVLDVEDVCKIFRVGKNRVYELLQTGRLGGFRLGRTWKIPKIALEAYLKHQSGSRL